MTFDGVKSGVPFISLGIGAWYNKSRSRRPASTRRPPVYAELEALNDKLVVGGITPVGPAGKYGWDIMRLFEYLLEHTAGPELHDKLLIGAESWDRPEVVDCVHAVQEVAGQEVAAGGCARPRSRRRRALVRPGQDGVHDHRTVDRGAGHPGGEEARPTSATSSCPTDQTPCGTRASSRAT